MNRNESASGLALSKTQACFISALCLQRFWTAAVLCRFKYVSQGLHPGQLFSLATPPFPILA
jgi:hypothetical protein